MTPNQSEAYQYLAQAQQARKAGDKRLARQYAEQAARLAPELEDVWLMMGALASPRASVVFMDKALQINPQSERVRQGMHWAVERLRKETPPKPTPVQPPAPVAHPPARKQSRIPFAMILLTAMCLVVLASAFFAMPSMAALINSSIGSSQNQPDWAVAQVAKPTYTLAPSVTALSTATELSDAVTPILAASPTDEIIAAPSDAPTGTMTNAPTEAESATPFLTQTATLAATEESSSTPLPTDDLSMPTPTALPTDTAVPQATAGPQATAYIPQAGSGGERWVDVDLTHQMVYAYEGNTLVNSFVVSTGTWQHPTVTGQYHVYVKFRYKNMSGPGYFLPDVPYTMFFYQGYALHGTYWHSNFGTPMSHGCVNLSIPDSEWLYNWASVGTLVNVHY